ncbi:MAG: hypothetical protein HETSPECPRED_005875 [Heterodermia speciosa]|uniref:Heterokaryon incompatibility domain-containing protein n=1 Tax=Heterodermia speciosa TaxID=116794 RepID=A0A8H3FQY0_9LECA|nr:MAG: hypothetical protein HETSPECPRED_005875 [Heterodermia speciosa]
MGKIYQNSTLNIAATAASGGEQGLDFPRDIFSSQPLRVEISWGSATGPESYYIVENSFWVRSVDQAPLNKRAWVLQERLLSPRIIHFGSNQLLWQCGLDSLCEMFPTASSKNRLGVGPAGYTDRDLRAFVPVLRLLQETPEEKLDLFLLEEAYRPWDTLVSTYSSMNLTEGEDKLIAIQAIAEAMQAAVRDRYIAGLWESRIVEDLLWRVCPESMLNGTSNRPKQWRAPSWSWASLDGPVQKATLPGRYAGRKQFDGESVVQDIDAFVEGYIGKTTGQLKSAKLDIRGYLYRSRKPPQGKWISRHENINIEGDDLPSINLWPDEWDWKADPSSRYELPELLYFFPIGTYQSITDGRVLNHFEGLMLVEDGSLGTFRRFGYSTVSAAEKGLDAAFEEPIEMESLKDGADAFGRQIYQFALI